MNLSGATMDRLIAKTDSDSVDKRMVYRSKGGLIMETEQQKVQVLTPVVTDERWTIGIATWGTMGYTPTGQLYPNEEEARTACKEFNERHGYNEKQAWMIVMKTMFPDCIYTLEDVLNAGTKGA